MRNAAPCSTSCPAPSRLCREVPATFEPLDPAAYAQIVRPQRWDWYLVTRWLPDLGPQGMAIVKALRTRCYHHRADGILRDTCEITLAELAAQVGVNERTLLRQFKNNAALAHFVRRLPRYVITGDGQPRRTANCFQVSMGDPLHEADRAAYDELVNELLQERLQELPPMTDKTACPDRQKAPRFAPLTADLSEHKVFRLPSESQLLKQQHTQELKAVPKPAAAVEKDNAEPIRSLSAELIACGVNRGDARRLARTDADECRKQLDYLPFVGEFKTSRGAYLRAAIEQGFAPPPAYTAREAAQQRERADGEKCTRQAAHRKSGQMEREREAACFAAQCREREAADPEGWTALVALAESRLPPPIRARPNGPAYRPALNTVLRALLAEPSA